MLFSCQVLTSPIAQAPMPVSEFENMLFAGSHQLEDMILAATWKSLPLKNISDFFQKRITGNKYFLINIDIEGVTLFPDKRMKFDFDLDYWIKFHFCVRIRDKITLCCIKG